MVAELKSADHPTGLGRRTAATGGRELLIAGLAHLHGHLPTPQRMVHRTLNALAALGTDRTAVVAVVGTHLLIVFTAQQRPLAASLPEPVKEQYAGYLRELLEAYGEDNALKKR